MTKKKKNSLREFDETALTNTSKAMPQKKGREGYAVYNFLEQEQKRLTSLDDLFSKKYINLKRYPQTEKLLLNEIYKKNLLREDLFDKISHDDSALTKHFEQIFNSAFR